MKKFEFYPGLILSKLVNEKKRIFLTMICWVARVS